MLQIECVPSILGKVSTEQLIVCKYYNIRPLRFELKTQRQLDVPCMAIFESQWMLIADDVQSIV